MSGEVEIKRTEFAFDDESEAKIPGIIGKYPQGRQASAVLALLDLAQRQIKRQTGHAWVPRKAMDVVADRLGMARIRVYEVATFHTMLYTEPVGIYHLQVCRTTPCWLRGSDEVWEACRKAVEEHGEMFTLEEVECLGACVNAPILQINDDYYEDLDASRTETLLEAFLAGEPPQPGSMIGRQKSAPEGGQTTLFSVPGKDDAQDGGKGRTSSGAGGSEGEARR